MTAPSTFTTADAERLFNLASLAPLKQHWNWVIWRWEPKKAGGLNKVLYQIDHPAQHASSTRPMTWGKFEDALRVAVAEGAGGIGFNCMGSVFAALDLDRCRNKETGIIAAWARRLIDACDSYTEITPSGTGLRIWGYGQHAKVAHPKIVMPDGGVLETFQEVGRYLTVTGEVFEHEREFRPLSPIIDEYQLAETTRKGTRPPRRERTPSETVNEERLIEALSFIPADDRDVWLPVGMACHTIDAREIWDDWSATSEKFDEDEQDKAWDSFHDDGGITCATIFALAQANGWRPHIETADLGPDCGMAAELVEVGPAGPTEAESPQEPPPTSADPPQLPENVDFNNFRAFADMGNYFFLPQGSTWPAKSIDARLRPVPVIGADGQPERYRGGKKDGQIKTIPASVWIDRYQMVESLTWAPGQPQLISGMRFKDGAWIESPDCTVLNLYRPPTINVLHANVQKVGLFIEHWHWLYPEDADHLLAWQACRVQFPNVKINHCLLLGGAPGIGKDTGLAPLKEATGPWNFLEVSPADVLGNWTYFRRSVIARISEAHDLGDKDRFQLYERLKVLTAAPPDMLSVNEKHLRQYSVANLVGLIITSNYRTDAIFLPPDDRRTYVAWSEIPENGLPQEKAKMLWDYYKQGGGWADIAVYFRQYDLSHFDPYAAPKKTEAFWSIVGAHRPKEEGALMDVLDNMKNPSAITIAQVQTAAGDSNKLAEWLADPRNGRAIPYRFESCGYVAHRNRGDRTKGYWSVQGKRQVVYVRKELTEEARETAVEALRNETPSLAAARFRDAAARREAEQAAMNLERAMKSDANKDNVVPFKSQNPWEALISKSPTATVKDVDFDEPSI